MHVGQFVSQDRRDPECASENLSKPGVVRAGYVCLH